MAVHTFTSTDAQQAYLFQCGDNGLFAVSLDASGENLPRGACVEGWRLKVPFLLGMSEPVPASISPEPILRGVRAVGYYVWREGRPHGTSP